MTRENPSQICPCFFFRSAATDKNATGGAAALPKTKFCHTTSQELNIYPLFSLTSFGYNKAIKDNKSGTERTFRFLNMLLLIFFIFSSPLFLLQKLRRMPQFLHSQNTGSPLPLGEATQRLGLSRRGYPHPNAQNNVAASQCRVSPLSHPSGANSPRGRAKEPLLLLTQMKNHTDIQ